MAKRNPNDDFRKLWRHISESKLQLMRNFSIGGAGISLATILLLAEIGIKDTALLISLLACAIGIPLWVALAQIFEVYIFHGRLSHAHLRKDFSINVVALLMLSGAVSMITSVAALLWHLNPIATYCFGGSSLAAAILSIIHGDHLSKHLARRGSTDEA